MAVRVFLVDDHEILRHGLRDLLVAEGDIDVVGEAGTVQEALHRIRTVEVDVAVLDVRLPDGSGIELCRQLRAADRPVACLMLTSYNEDEALLDAIVAGAAGYLLKEGRGADIVSAVRHVGEGGSLIDAATTRRVNERILAGAAKDRLLAGLSHQEQRIIQLLADGKTNRQIAAEMLLTEKTVKNYVSHLLTKMGMSRRTEAAVYAARHDERTHRPPHLG
ncbi:MAG: LuxR family transcriptional regulator [Ilumatobacteraceae bacterium]|nr:LuxR family transcriptional regulator [Ilumatobacteraceae bacterium]